MRRIVNGGEDCCREKKPNADKWQKHDNEQTKMDQLSCCGIFDLTSCFFLSSSSLSLYLTLSIELIATTTTTHTHYTKKKQNTHTQHKQQTTRMVRYSVEPDVPEKTSKSRGSHLRVHYKHCREIAHMTRGMTVEKALKLCDDVMAFKTTVTFSRHTGGIGHHAQAKQHKAPGNAGRWPVKAMRVYRDLLTNAVANAEVKGLADDTDKLVISHAQVNRAPPRTPSYLPCPRTHWQIRLPTVPH